MVGKSKITPLKQEDLSNLIMKQMGSAYGVIRSKSWAENRFHLIDCTSGDMLDIDSSPAAFINASLRFQDLNIKLELVEKDKKTFYDLRKNVQWVHPEIAINFSERIKLNFVNKDIIDHLNNLFINSKWYFGFLYYDPNGWKVEPYIAISNFLKVNPRMDVAVNFNTTTIKRTRCVNNDSFSKFHGLDFETSIKMLHKKNVWIRDHKAYIKTTQGFVMVFGTNHPDFDFGKTGLENYHHWKSEKGIEIINDCNCTKKEKECK